MKVSELTGAKLAQWVALALGYKVERDGRELVVYLPKPIGIPHSFSKYGWRPDLKWEHGGPIIDREGICIAGRAASYSLDELYHGEGATLYYGGTALEAAMRCLVSKKYGNEVPDAN